MLFPFLRLGWGKRMFCYFGGSPTLAVEGRVDKSTYLGVRPTEFKTAPRFAHNNNDDDHLVISGYAPWP